MWEQSTTTSPRVKSLRRILTFCLSAFVAAFSWSLIYATNSYAVTATWSSTSSINYENNTYNGPVGDTINAKLGIAPGSKAYTSVDPITSTDAGSTADYTRKIRVIYFDSATGVEDSVAANYKTLTYLGPENFTNPSAVSVISIDKQSESSISSSGSSCAISGGMGWIICPITNFLAKGMDWIFDIIRGFLVVRPVMTNQDSSLYRAWSYSRSVANVAFVLAFIAIIYSQLTSVGISNYGIKKLLPRLVVAAILVNVSYFICAIAVDLSNILGYSIQDVLITIRNGVAGTNGNSWDLVSWTSITGFILSGGAAATAGTIALVSTLSTYGIAGSIFLLLPTLLTGLLAVLVALVIMAARQALVTVLIILAPLAFVAYLLPNTEKWFEKWKSTLSTMLVLFPAFSLIYGGSQLASSLIIQNADSINTLILGMILQVVPLFMTPFLIKMSGSIIGRVAGVINNPNKGPIDRARKFTKDHTDVIAAKRLGQQAKPHQFLRQNAQRIDHRRRRREGWKSSYGAMTDARWANSSDFSNIDQNTREYQERKALGESHSELRYSESKISNGRIQELDVRIREIKLQSENAKLVSNVQWENNGISAIVEEKTRSRVLNEQLSLAKMTNDNNFELSKSRKYAEVTDGRHSDAIQGLMEEARNNAQSLAIQAMRKQSINRVLSTELADSLVLSQANREVAGASIINDHGSDSAYASAVMTIRESYGKAVKDRTQLMAHFNIDAAQYQAMALRGEVAYDANGNKMYDANGKAIINSIDSIVATTKTSDGTEVSYTFNANDEYNTEAAIDRQLKVGLYKEKRDIIEESGVGGALHDFASSIAGGMASYDVGSKAPQFGGGSINLASQGKFKGHITTLTQAANFIGDGKFKAEDIANADTVALIDMIEAIHKATAGEIYDSTPGGQEKFNNFRKSTPKFLDVAYQILDLDNNIGKNASEGTKKQLKKLLRDSGRALPENISPDED